MHSRLPNAPASYLPTKKSQQASEARIAKINELYESIKKKHQDSVVSNNSTSVASDEQEADNCIQVNGLDYRLPSVSHTEEPSVTVKEEDAMNVFRLNQTPTPPERLQRLGSENNHRAFEEEDDEDDYEAELRFTPKFKSRRSLITMKQSSSLQKKVHPVVPNKVRRPSRVSSLRKALGDPLPLPYVGKRKLSNGIDPGLGFNNSLTNGTINKNRQMMERKWKKLISQDRDLIEKRFAEIRQRSSQNNPDISFNDALPPPVSVSTAGQQNVNSLSELNKEIIANREKLDHIIGLLSHQQNVATRTIKLQRPSREVQHWTICIIVLIICNLYVYYYL